MRISATTLESFRLYCDPEQDWMTEADILATIRGEFVPTRKIEIGHAFGRILENPEKYRATLGSVAGYHHRRLDVFFPEATMQPALDLIDRRHTVFEAKATRAYGPHDVVAKADQLVGAHLVETKTTFDSFDFHQYADSCQWRFMVDIFEPAYVTYQVFPLKEAGDGSVVVGPVHTFDLFPYSALHTDCANLVRRFVDFVTVKGLAPLLERRQIEAA